MPCTMCAKRGLVCGEAQKVTARDTPTQIAPSKEIMEVDVLHVDKDYPTIEIIPCPQTTPAEQSLPSCDGLYMEFYWYTSSMWFDLINDRTTNSSHPFAICTAHRFGPYISSKLVRSAILFYSSFRKDRSLSYSAMLYLAQFYEYARQAIDQNSYVDLVYACYIMCIVEMTCRRRLFGEFEKHANGFLISYEKVLLANMLTMEEKTAMSRAYTLLSQMARIPSSEWYQDESWFEFTSAVTQRMDSATARAITVKRTCTIQSNVWIPHAHHLFAAQNIVYQLCTHFNRLSRIAKRRWDYLEYEWDETIIAIEGTLSHLADIVFGPTESGSLGSEVTSSYLLTVPREEPKSMPSDRHARELMTLYYAFHLQYYIMIREWSDLMWSNALRAAHAVCRLYPAPHEAQYPTPDLRFIVNRGLLFALMFVADSKNFQRTTSIRKTD